MGALTVIAAGIGFWFLIEGLIVAFAPETVRRLTRLISEMPERELALAGLAAATLGGALVTLAVRLA